ncbi:hypothetical protein HPB50_023096 [Hyalomma asiaticum]|uniref:Uncharacterized protein n=1 Tax=Hyalomma asiaticum TaxID=266040 RepID=A0ACB7TPI9_HYAAI|nr:hypothetical protein HPB50_023096 [Hyalomma asiaticum]
MSRSPMNEGRNSPNRQRATPVELTPVHQRASRRLRGDSPEFAPLSFTPRETRTTDAATMTSQGFVVTWSLLALCPGSESHSTAAHLWQRLRKMTFPGRHRGGPTPMTSMFALQPDFAGPFLYGRGSLPRLPWQKLYVYNRPMGFRHWRRENRPSMQGRKLTKIKVVKKFVTQSPVDTSGVVFLLSPHVEPPRTAPRWPVKHSASLSWTTPAPISPSNWYQPSSNVKVAPRIRTRPRSLVYFTGAHSSDPRAQITAGSSMKDITIIHNARKYTISASSKARLKGHPGLVVHVKGM